MKLGMEVGLGLGHIVLDGDPAPCPGPCLLWPKGWMDQDAIWYGGIVSAQATVLDGAQLPPKGHSPPNFWPMSILAKRLDGSTYHLAPR